MTEPPIYALGGTELSLIFSFLDVGLDQFHFSGVMQQSKSGRNMPKEMKPRCLFQRMARLPRKKRPKNLKRALAQTTKWIKDEGRCNVCLEQHWTYLDKTIGDGHTRCFRCVKTFHEPYRCGCGGTFRLRESISSMGEFLLLSCEKRALWECWAAEAPGEPHPYTWAEWFERECGHPVEEFDAKRCYEQIRLSEPRCRTTVIRPEQLLWSKDSTRKKGGGKELCIVQ